MSVIYVLDTSALMQAYIQDENTEQVLALLGQLTQEEPPTIHFLDIGLAEANNVFWKHIQRGNIDLETALQRLQDLQSLPLVIHATTPHMESALTIAVNYEITVYDALFIALAQSLNATFITADKRQSQAAQQAGVQLKPLTDFATPATEN